MEETKTPLSPNQGPQPKTVQDVIKKSNIAIDTAKSISNSLLGDIPRIANPDSSSSGFIDSSSDVTRVVRSSSGTVVSKVSTISSRFDVKPIKIDYRKSNIGDDEADRVFNDFKEEVYNNLSKVQDNIFKGFDVINKNIENQTKLLDEHSSKIVKIDKRTRELVDSVDQLQKQLSLRNKEDPFAWYRNGNNDEDVNEQQQSSGGGLTPSQIAGGKLAGDLYKSARQAKGATNLLGKGTAAGGAWDKALAGAKLGAKGALIGGALTAGIEYYQTGNSSKSLILGAGSAIGSVVGGAAGAVIGSVVPGPGTAIGGFAGAVGGGLMGEDIARKGYNWWTGNKDDKSLDGSSVKNETISQNSIELEARELISLKSILDINISARQLKIEAKELDLDVQTFILNETTKSSLIRALGLNNQSKTEQKQDSNNKPKRSHLDQQIYDRDVAVYGQEKADQIEQIKQQSFGAQLGRIGQSIKSGWDSLTGKDTQSSIQEQAYKRDVETVGKDKADAIATSKGVNPENFKVGSSSTKNDDLRVGVYNAFRSTGMSHEGALIMSGEVNRENGFNPNLIFGNHKDPHNGAVNAGMFSWQGSRGIALIKHLEENGAIDKNGNIIRNQKTLNLMAEFAAKEMNQKEYGNGALNKLLSQENLDRNETADIIGRKYIKWRRDDPQYAATGLKNREEGYLDTKRAVASSKEKNINSDQPVISGEVEQKQSSLAKTRTGQIKPELESQLKYASAQTGVTAEIFSGGQPSSGPNRVGSHRHDDGGAADLKLYVMEGGKKRYLDSSNPNDAVIMEKFVAESVKAGASGVGHGAGYMGTQSIHIGGGHPASWGGSSWIENARKTGVNSREEFNKQGGLAAWVDLNKDAAKIQKSEMPAGYDAFLGKKKDTLSNNDKEQDDDQSNLRKSLGLDWNINQSKIEFNKLSDTEKSTFNNENIHLLSDYNKQSTTQSSSLSDVTLINKEDYDNAIPLTPQETKLSPELTNGGITPPPIPDAQSQKYADNITSQAKSDDKKQSKIENPRSTIGDKGPEPGSDGYGAQKQNPDNASGLCLV